jgi:hypothetical protein
MLCQIKLISLLIVARVVGKKTSHMSKQYLFKYQNYSHFSKHTHKSKHFPWQ